MVKIVPIAAEQAQPSSISDSLGVGMVISLL